MEFYLNEQHILGELIKDAEIRTTKSNKEIAVFTILTKHSRKVGDKYEERPTYHNCVLWNPSVYEKKQFVKGNRFMIIGRTDKSSYEKDGKTIYKTDVVVNKIILTHQRVDYAEAKEKPEAEPKQDDDLPF